MGLDTLILRFGEAYLFGDKLFLSGEPERAVVTRLAEFIRFIMGDGFFGDLIDEVTLPVGEMERFDGEIPGLLGDVLNFLLGGEPKRLLLGLFEGLFFFFLAGDFLRGTVAVLIAVSWETGVGS